MRRIPSTRSRLVLALALATAGLVTLGTGAALAGGIADVVPIPGDGHAIEAGTETTLEFTLLAHGRTPVDFGTATVVVTDTSNGDAFRVTAEAAGQPGQFRATLAFPRPGWWTWHVEHDGLLIESGPTVVGVMGGDMGFPVYTPGGSRTSAGDLLNDVARRTAERDALQARLDATTAQLADANHQAQVAESRPTFTAVAAVGLVAAIAGLLGGLALGWLATRPRGVRDVSPSLTMEGQRPK